MTVAVSVEEVGEEESGTYTLPEGATITDLLEELDRNPEALVVKRNGKIVPEEEKLEDGDEVVIIPVVSGG